MSWKKPLDFGGNPDHVTLSVQFSSVQHAKINVMLMLDTSRPLLLLLYAVTHAPFHAPVLRPTSWPNARDRRDGEVN